MFLRVAAVVSAGLLAGIFFGHRASVQHATPELSASSFVQLQQIIHAQYVVFMPPLVLTALLSSVLWVFMVRSQWRTVEFWLVAIRVRDLRDRRGNPRRKHSAQRSAHDVERHLVLEAMALTLRPAR